MTSETKISFALSFVSGFVDTAGFIALFGLFTAHVTGNLVLAGAAIGNAGEQGNLAAKLLMLPVFVLSVAFAAYLLKYKRSGVQQLVLVEACFIVVFSLAGRFLLHSGLVPVNSAIALTAAFAVMGMGIQNTYMRKLLNSYTPNTVMTGNFTQFSLDLFNIADYFFAAKAKRQPAELAAAKASLKKVANVLGGFLTGCLLGALLVKQLGLICCLLPALLLLWVAAQKDPALLKKN